MTGYNVDGEKLRILRRRAGLTQEQLALLVDCSDRLIRKAERGGSLRYEIIEEIAKQLSITGVATSVHDLAFTDQLGNLGLAQRFVEAFDEHGVQMLEHVSSFAMDIELVIPGDATIVSFAGVWKGLDGLQDFLNTYFRDFSREPNSLVPTFLQTHDQVTARFIDCCSYRGQLLLSFWTNLHFTFRDGLICRIEDHYDTLKLHQDILAIRQIRNELAS